MVVVVELIVFFIFMIGFCIEKDFGPPYPPLKIEQNSISPHRGKIGICRKDKKVSN